ncbi:MAG: hypothetical protein QXI16_03030 [Sulfolobaceae archaeon]
MITDAFFNFLAMSINFFINLLPAPDDLPVQFDEALTFFGDFLASWSQVLPSLIYTFTIIGIIIFVQGLIFLFHGIDWIINKFRGSG